MIVSSLASIDEFSTLYGKKSTKVKGTPVSYKKALFYILIFFRLRFSAFQNRLGETKITNLHFSVTNLHFSFTDLIT